jgi:hypothetical protein
VVIFLMTLVIKRGSKIEEVDLILTQFVIGKKSKDYLMD